MIVGFRPTRLLGLVALAALAIGVAACGGGGENSPTASPVATVTAADAIAAVEEFDAEDLEASVSRLNAAGLSGTDDVVAEMATFFDDPDDTKRWAAVYVAALAADTTKQGDILAGALDDLLLEPRVMAAGSLAGLGYVESLPVLVAAAGVDDEFSYRDLPAPMSEFAIDTLTAYTEESFEDSSDWEEWWRSVEDSIRWDGEMYVAE